MDVGPFIVNGVFADAGNADLVILPSDATKHIYFDAIFVACEKGTTENIISVNYRPGGGSLVTLMSLLVGQGKPIVNGTTTGFTGLGTGTYQGTVEGPGDRYVVPFGGFPLPHGDDLSADSLLIEGAGITILPSGKHAYVTFFGRIGDAPPADGPGMASALTSINQTALANVIAAALTGLPVDVSGSSVDITGAVAIDSTTPVQVQGKVGAVALPVSGSVTAAISQTGTNNKVLMTTDPLAPPLVDVGDISLTDVTIAGPLTVKPEPGNPLIVKTTGTDFVTTKIL